MLRQNLVKHVSRVSVVAHISCRGMCELKTLRGYGHNVAAYLGSFRHQLNARAWCAAVHGGSIKWGNNDVATVTGT